MGQGYSMTTPSAASASIDVPELSDLAFDRTLVSARFMKSIRARNQHGFVFVKAVMKPYSTFDSQKYIRRLMEERQALSDISNALSYQRIVETGTGGFLARQYVFSSVYDRLSTRPFLEDIEKKWLAYQLLCVVRDCHAREIYHGDIKTENTLVTSWNWLFLADFSSYFKPTTLPEDNPADFSFYFDTSGRRTCYVAPERFTTGAGDEPYHELNWAMDMFSVGCVIAEIFLEGPIFSLSQIFKYRIGEYSPEHTHLNKIEDPDVREMVLNMIELEPEKRWSADQHLSYYKPRIFPDYFESFLHHYMRDLTEPSTTQEELGLDVSNMAESDDKIDRVWQDFDKISYFLGYGTGIDLLRQPGHHTQRRHSKRSVNKQVSGLHDGTLIFLTLVSASLRNSTKSSSRLKACDLLVAFAERLPDEVKLDRIVPYVATMLTDPSEIVQVSAIRALTTIFEMIEVVSPINAFIFPEYIFPKLRTIASTEKIARPLVRAAYASCLASLSLSSARVLDMVQAIRADGRLPALNEAEWAPGTSFHALYDPSKEELVRHFEEATVILITDEDSSVRRALLGSVARLCVFFGSVKANEIILQHLNTYLNERDWILKCSFFDALVGIATYVGTSSLEKFILPIMVGSLTDPEPFVVEKVLRSLARMADLGLLQKASVWELVSMAARFLVHPSTFIREAALHFIVLASKYTSKADTYCILLPLLQPYLKAPVIEVAEEQLLNNLKKPLSRGVFSAALHQASIKTKSLFWTAASQDGAFVLSDPELAHFPTKPAKRSLTRIPPSQKDKDDQISLETLRSVGMGAEDEMKLLALREYILHVATAPKPQVAKDANVNKVQGIVPLHTLDIRTQNVLFDTSQPIRSRQNHRPPVQRSQSALQQRHTLAEALLDASTTNFGPANDVAQATASTPVDIRGRTEATSKGKMADSGPSSRNPSSAPGHKPSSELDKLSLRRGKLELRHRNSSLALMKRDTGKAEAETSTSEQIAFGKVDGPLQKQSDAVTSALSATAVAAARSSRSKSPSKQLPSTLSWEPNHSYAGNDPTILRLLDNHFVENFAIEQMDFGEPCESAARMPLRKATDFTTMGQSGSQDTTTPHYDPWRPAGRLLTHFAEHTAAINQVCASPDHAFFVTASDDGTCKVWDTIRLEKNVTPRSRSTYRHGTDLKVKALCFIEDSHTFISAADNGSIHAVKVEYRVVDGGESTKYGRPVLVRDYQIPAIMGEKPHVNSTEHAIQILHYRTTSSLSVLVVATNHNRILMIDMKTMNILAILEEPLHHGSVTAFVVDKHHHWLVSGTTHGTLSLWDLRFRIHLRSFTLPTQSCIDRLVMHPSKGFGKWVIVSSAGEISVWDVDKVTCREVFRPYTFSSDSSSVEGDPSTTRIKPYTPIFADSQHIPPVPSTPPAPTSTRSTQSIRALHIALDFISPASRTPNANNNTSSSKYPLLFTAGGGTNDSTTLRYWDLPTPEDSYILSSPAIHSDESSGVLRARYAVSHPLSLSSGAQVQLVQESAPEASGVGVGRGKKGAAGGKRATKQAPTSTQKKDERDKPTRQALLAGNGSRVLGAHMEGVTDLIVLRKPYGIVPIPNAKSMSQSLPRSSKITAPGGASKKPRNFADGKQIRV
ncbi:Serine/threonine-protein kinase VPS15 [Cyphellophora attinorum]|uniref:non-specific serine/threonine protein kinase n=1 Tax=Cyphellophora attinorum TaxID=1664694 RepID=A0A0N1GYU8_9EURO|nr:Serine/threonine-protein kinase VPS15 [Phialophora attinorum]KPI36077.1 Serine/threonine-protein kinase VPS15 [Phialophora attinorum]